MPERKELHRENATEVCRGYSASLQLSTVQHMRYYSPEKNHLKSFKGTLTEANPGLAIVSVPTCRNGKSYNLQANGKNSQRVLAPQGAKFLFHSCLTEFESKTQCTS